MFAAAVSTDLQLTDLTTVFGGGKKAKTKVGKWMEKTFGDGDGEHEGSDYVDEFIKVITIIAGSGGNVHQPPGEENTWRCDNGAKDANGWWNVDG